MTWIRLGFFKTEEILHFQADYGLLKLNQLLLKRGIQDSSVLECEMVFEGFPDKESLADTSSPIHGHKLRLF